MDENITNETNIGIVKISDEVVSVIAGVACSDIKGIAGMSTGIVGGITQILGGKKNVSKGVKVTVGEDNTAIDLYVIVDYGINIPEVAKQVQESVKKAVETMTGLEVSAVNIYVQNVILNKEENKEEAGEE